MIKPFQEYIAYTQSYDNNKVLLKEKFEIK